MRIQELTIYSTQISQQKDFYTRTLDFNILNESDQHVSFQIGASKLTIRFKEGATPYHFAFNIPSHQEQEALDWLKGRVAILKDQDYEIQDFDNWNAKAVYFYDTDNNIVEFIARKNLNYQSKTPFSSDTILEISEIGVPVNEIKTVYKSLSQHVKLEIYDGGFDRFCAIGDEHGLFICIDKNVKDWFPTGDQAYPSEFKMRFTHKGKYYKAHFVNDELRIIEPEV